MSLAFGSYVFAISLAKDVKVYLNEIDQHIKSKKTRSEIMPKLNEFIQFTNLRELSFFLLKFHIDFFIV